MSTPHPWLAVHPGQVPLVVSLPHTGTDLPPDLEARLVSPWRARRDADFWVDVLYDFARDLDATTVRTALSRSVIDVNRDPSGASLYPGQATTGLCPLETFDGDPLYLPGQEPDAAEIERRRRDFFDPYHAALAAQLARLQAAHGTVILWDAHSIRSRVPRLFDGELPQFNLGTNGGQSCDPGLQSALERHCAASGHSWVSNGRFRGGWITRHYGQPGRGVHAVQMELAMRGYLVEPDRPDERRWPVPLDETRAAPLRRVLAELLRLCIRFATAHGRTP